MIEFLTGLLRALGESRILQEQVCPAPLYQVAQAVVLAPEQMDLVGEAFQERDDELLLHPVRIGNLRIQRIQGRIGRCQAGIAHFEFPLHGRQLTRTRHKEPADDRQCQNQDRHQDGSGICPFLHP